MPQNAPPADPKLEKDRKAAATRLDALRKEGLALLDTIAAVDKASASIKSSTDCAPLWVAFLRQRHHFEKAASELVTALAPPWLAPEWLVRVQGAVAVYVATANAASIAERRLIECLERKDQLPVELRRIGFENWERAMKSLAARTEQERKRLR